MCLHKLKKKSYSLIKFIYSKSIYTSQWLNKKDKEPIFNVN